MAQSPLMETEVLKLSSTTASLAVSLTSAAWVVVAWQIISTARNNINRFFMSSLLVVDRLENCCQFDCRLTEPL